MTAEELIIGHYEKTLNTEQESRLAAMVAGSPDVRGLFEQHGNIHNLMVDDAGAVQTSSKLDKVVLGAALGTLAEIAGHGIGFSLLGKVATVIGVVAAGGVGVLMYNNMTDDEAAVPKAKPAVTRSADVPSTPVNPAAPTATTDDVTPSDDVSSTTNTSDAASTIGRTDNPDGRATRSSANDASTTPSTTQVEPARPPVRLNPDAPDATIDDTSKIKARPNK